MRAVGQCHRGGRRRAEWKALLPATGDSIREVLPELNHVGWQLRPVGNERFQLCPLRSVEPGELEFQRD
jgi:hypothetical protein